MTFSVKLWRYSELPSAAITAKRVAVAATQKDGFKTRVTFKRRGPGGSYVFKVRRWKRGPNARPKVWFADLPDDAYNDLTDLGPRVVVPACPTGRCALPPVPARGTDVAPRLRYSLPMDKEAR